MHITLKTLTPLWTGGVDQTCDRLHETGLIGSLRWWYEALVRGLGGYACDPTAEGRCEYDPKKNVPPEKQLCMACYLFGCTGWARRFRLQIIAQGKPAWEDNRSLNVRPYGRDRGWYFYPGHVGTVNLALSGDTGVLSQLLALFRFLEAWGSLGPRPQLGYGVFRIVGIDGEPCALLWSPLGNALVGNLPDLRAFTFFKLRFTPRAANWWIQVSGLRPLSGKSEWSIVQRMASEGMVPVMPALKNYLRFEQQWSVAPLPHWLFGTLRGDERMRSKVAFSWAYRLPEKEEWEVRGWVYLPDDSRGRAFHPEVVRTLDNALRDPTQWQRAMGLSTSFRSATISYAPSSAPWQRIGQTTVAHFLNSFAS